MSGCCYLDSSEIRLLEQMLTAVIAPDRFPRQYILKYDFWHILFKPGYEVILEENKNIYCGCILHFLYDMSRININVFGHSREWDLKIQPWQLIVPRAIVFERGNDFKQDKFDAIIDYYYKAKEIDERGPNTEYLLIHLHHDQRFYDRRKLKLKINEKPLYGEGGIEEDQNEVFKQIMKEIGWQS